MLAPISGRHKENQHRACFSSPKNVIEPFFPLIGPYFGESGRPAGRGVAVMKRPAPRGAPPNTRAGAQRSRPAPLALAQPVGPVRHLSAIEPFPLRPTPCDPPLNPLSTPWLASGARK